MSMPGKLTVSMVTFVKRRPLYSLKSCSHSPTERAACSVSNLFVSRSSEESGTGRTLSCGGFATRNVGTDESCARIDIIGTEEVNFEQMKELITFRSIFEPFPSRPLDKMNKMTVTKPRLS